MIAEAISKILETAKLGAVPSIVHPECEPEYVYYLNNEMRLAQPTPRNNTALSLDAIFKLVTQQSGARTEETGDYEVWYSHEGVVCFPDRKIRRGRVSMALELSDQLAEITRWGTPPSGGMPFPQAELILMLRTKFKYCVAGCPGLLPAVRGLKFSTSNKGESTIGHGKASIGRQIETEVSGAQQLPEDFVLNVPIFKKVFPGMSANIEIALDMNATAEKLVLYPVAQSIDQAIAEAEVKIGEMLLEELDSARVLFGRP